MVDPTFLRSVWQRPIDWLTPHRPLRPDERVDLAIVGAGIQGLSASLHAAKQGLDVRVLEARSIGAGASGVNGGQVIPGLKYDPETLFERFGTSTGKKIVAFAADTANCLFDLIENEQLAVPRTRDGWIQAAHTEKALAGLSVRDRQWRARGADVGLLSTPEIKYMTGAEGYLGGWWDRRAGAIDPLAFVCELARVASAAGVEIAEHTPVTKLRSEGGGWTVETPEGVLRAKNVLVATNAYSERLIPGLAQSLVWLHSFQVATELLTPEQEPAVLPGGQPVSDSRRILVYYRKTADGRLIVGGRGRMGQPRREADWAHLDRALYTLFPALKGVRIEKRWFGRVAMTPDHLSHIHEPEPGLLTAAGCQGRGVGLMTALGPRLADYLATRDPIALPFPITPIRPIPLHPFRRLGASGLIAWNRLLDAHET